MKIAPVAFLLALSACKHAPAAAPDRGSIEKSNENAQVLLEVAARFAPEQAARLGVPGLDDRISDFTPGHRQRQRQALREALARLQQKKEEDPMVAEDLEILVAAAKRQIRGSELSEKYEVPYTNLPRLVFGNVRSLLDVQVAPERRPAALERVRKYAGVVALAEDETRAGLAQASLLPPSRLEVEEDLRTAPFLIDGVEKLFKQFEIPGHVEPVAKLKAQLAQYVEFVRAEVLPRARDDFRLPPELYAFRLEQFGVDIPPAELATRAHAAFAQYQSEMNTVAARLGFDDYRKAIRELKKQQIPDGEVLAHYQKRLADIEQIIREHRLVSLPGRAARIRLGTPAENAQQPAPHMVPPRLLGNTGEQGEFVLPLGIPGAAEMKYDDFNYSAASWTLTAHEARPGHELQFDGMVERGVSIARAIFAGNSANTEGWGLYAEAITLPYMPDDGKLISLQLRLQRAARAFVDPELQLGKWTPQDAREFLQREVVLSPAFAKEEVDRFTFRAPGQATSYFYGYTRLLELRAEVEKKLGANFDAQRFHDLILAQGLLPPDLLRRAVLSAL
ncbi:MAG: DUF885 domain-containing protein [Deltaproteobacteria bacterium]|nr:MAG: DUF885 domain-containing protein [Deltaproteobacteria bacterium]